MITGYCDPAFQAVKRAFEENFSLNDSVADVGAATSLYVDGKLRVNLWGGYTDAAKRVPWGQETTVCVFSCTKALVALCLHRLVDENKADYDSPIGDYWAEFNEQGKGGITLRHLLSHQAGLPTLREPLLPGGLFRWKETCNALANERPHWEPGQAHGYHILSFGHIVGELVQRISGQPLSSYIKNEIVDPSGIHFSLGSHNDDVAELLMPPESTLLGGTARKALAIDPLQLTKYNDPYILTPPIVNSVAWKRAAIPGANGFSNAKSLAGLYSLLVDGSENLISKERVREMSVLQCEGMDKTLLRHNAWAMGFQLNAGKIRFSPRDSHGSFGHYGIYGSVGFADPEVKVGFGYTLNQCGEPDDHTRAHRIVDAIYESL